jgi:hypothetical protein
MGPGSIEKPAGIREVLPPNNTPSLKTLPDSQPSIQEIALRQFALLNGIKDALPQHLSERNYQASQKKVCNIINSMTFQDREVNSVVALFAKVETDTLVREACQKYFERYLLQPPDKINQ